MTRLFKRIRDIGLSKTAFWIDRRLNSPKDLIMNIGFASFQFDGNIKYIYLKLDEIMPGCCFFVTDDQKEIERVSHVYPNVRSYYMRDPTKSELYNNTKIWITSHGNYVIPVPKRNSIWIDVGHGIEVLQNKMVKYMKTLNDRYDYVFVCSRKIKELYYNNGNLKLPDAHVIVTGYSRCDYFFNKQIVESDCKDRLLYAPSYAPLWRSSAFDVSYNFNFSLIDEWCKKNRKVFLVRAHKMQNVKKVNGLENVVFMPQSQHWDTEEVLLSSEILITDYSSIFNDFVLLNRPIIHLSDRHEQLVLPYEQYPFYNTVSSELMQPGGLDNLIDLVPHHNTQKYTETIHDYRDGKSSQRAAKKILELYEDAK